MKEIHVKSQKELDAIKIDYYGKIYIEFGSPLAPAVVTQKYLFPVVAWGNSSVEAWENSSVEAWENSSVVACGNSSVEAWGNSSVEARENSSVEAWGNSSVEAWENSSVVAWGNCQVTDRGTKGVLSANGNARIVHDPKTIYEYCSFHGIEVDGGTGKFFKSVHKKNGRYFSDHDRLYEYKIGEISLPDFFDNSSMEKCGHGIHVAHKAWVIDFGKSWDDIAILEVEANLKDVVVPENCGGKVRCKSVKVIREVPLEECGLYGKFLSNRKNHI